MAIGGLSMSHHRWIILPRPHSSPYHLLRRKRCGGSIIGMAMKEGWEQVGVLPVRVVLVVVVLVVVVVVVVVVFVVAVVVVLIYHGQNDKDIRRKMAKVG